MTYTQNLWLYFVLVFGIIIVPGIVKRWLNCSGLSTMSSPTIWAREKKRFHIRSDAPPRPGRFEPPMPISKRVNSSSRRCPKCVS